MKRILSLWGHFEEFFITLLLSIMTLVTFFYVVFNNVYELFFFLGNEIPSIAFIVEPIGEFIMWLAQEMTWSIAITKLCFGWLIFFGASYGVRTAGHIGVDVLVKMMKTRTQRVVSILSVSACMAYSVLIAIASYDWISAMFVAGIGADDLHHFHIQLWQVGLIMPIGYGLIAIRFFEIFIRILQGRQTGLGLADESKDAVKLAQGES
ncbi:C4-dicarboxylate ABC transporter [Basilea psittacipulmonis DSM 24701]|uniref:TRAP transporter small permease protein n=2 Tax=Basilea TaxID=1472344 RepID=A0A077DGT3_9BURK|nr:C4-dicarboxylate ABC transporter [Basilea psittacipulmonis DSM 24701]